MAMLALEAIPIQKFTILKDQHKLVADASDLPARWLNRVWDDACDLGMQIQGYKGVKTFTLIREEYKGEELIAWHLTEYKRPHSCSVNHVSWDVTVFND